MADIKLVTKLWLHKCPLPIDYKWTYAFLNISEQSSFFHHDPVIEGVQIFNFTYIAKDSTIRLNMSLDEAMKYNYVSYMNSSEDDTGYYFAFITDYQWRSDEVTEITIKTDVMQTWLPKSKKSLNSYSILPSFVEREHTKDDTIGANTILENLETGEYICNGSLDYDEIKHISIVVGVTAKADGSALRGKRYWGSYSGISYYAFPFDTAGIGALNNFISSYDKSSDVDNNAIVSMFLAPSELTPVPQDADSNQVAGSESPFSDLIHLSKNMNALSYAPKNNKLYCFPYRYLLVTNNNGGAAVYNYEHFSEERIAFAIHGVLTPGCSIRAIPLNYKGQTTNYDEGLNLGKFPICNWASDEYTNWLTTNGVNIGLNVLAGIGKIVGGAVGVAVSGYTGGVSGAMGVGAIASGVGGIAGQLAQIHEASLTPPQLNGNVNNGDVITAINKNTFSFYEMCIKPEYMKVIDDYLSTYGYKCNRFKVPNNFHRNSWWFIKTVDVNISGDIPAQDKLKIQECYNNGITFWKASQGATIDYSKSNEIVV